MADIQVIVVIVLDPEGVTSNQCKVVGFRGVRDGVVVAEVSGVAIVY